MLFAIKGHAKSVVGAPGTPTVAAVANKANGQSPSSTTGTVQRFLACHAGVADGRMTRKGEKAVRATFSKNTLVVDEGSLASTVQPRDLPRIADPLRIPRVVPVADWKHRGAMVGFCESGR